jgi:molybdopterin converting factor small subunit
MNQKDTIEVRVKFVGYVYKGKDVEKQTLLIPKGMTVQGLEEKIKSEMDCKVDFNRVISIVNGAMLTAGEAQKYILNNGDTVSFVMALAGG